MIVRFLNSVPLYIYIHVCRARALYHKWCYIYKSAKSNVAANIINWYPPRHAQQINP